MRLSQVPPYMQWSKRISEAFEAVSLGHDWPVLVHSLPEGTWVVTQRNLPLIEVQQLLGTLPANLESMCLMLALIHKGHVQWLC